MKLIIVRHGETDTNARKRRTGWSNPPLNQEGVNQATALQSWFDSHKDFHIVSSDLDRAKQTAEIASRRTVELMPELRERNWLYETQDEFTNRVQLAYNKIAELGDVVVFTHGRTARLLESLHSRVKLSQVKAYGNGELREIQDGLSLF